MLRASVVLLAIICLSGCGWSPLGSKEEYLRRGRDFAANGKDDDAILQYRKAFQKDPNYGEAYLAYGQLFVSQHKITEAFAALSRAVELIPASQPAALREARVALGRTAVSALLGDPRRPEEFYQAAGKMATALLATDPRSFEGLRLKGYLAFADSHPKDTIQYFREALSVNPNLPDVLTILVQTLFSENQDAEAETLARNGLVTFKNYSPLSNALYGYYMAHNRAAEAEQILRSQIANNPKQTYPIIQLADHLQGQKKSREADELLRAFVANTSDFPSAPLDAGDFYRRAGNQDEAVRLYQLGLASSAQGKPDRRIDYLRRILAVRLSQSHQQEAFDAVEALLKQFPGDVDALATRADLRMASGKPEEMQKAVAELADLVKKQPARNDVRETLGRVYRQLGRDQEAQASFREVLQKDPNNRGALREMADISIRAQKPDEALGYAERLLAIDPQNTGARLVRTAAWALRGRFTEVRAELRRLTTEHPDLNEAWLQTSTLAVQTKNYAEAEQIFRRLDEPGKGDIRALKGLVLVYMTQGQPQKALAVARQDAARAGDPQVRTVLAGVAAQAGDLDLALATAKQLVADSPDDPERLTLLGDIYRRRGQLDQAIPVFQQARSKAAGNPGPGSYLANALEQAGRFDEAVDVSRENLKLAPTDPFLMNALAWHLALAGKSLGEATTLSQQALQKQPGNSAFEDTAGMVYLKSGKLDDALRTFQQLVLKQGEVPAYRTHLAAVLIQRGDRQRARTELETALRSHPTPAEQDEIRKLLKSAA